MNRFLLFALASIAYAATTITPSAPKLDSDGCYAISTTEELYGFADIVNASKTHDECGKLTADIKLNYYDGYSEENLLWNPIKLFRGVFDGQNHTIVGLHQYGAEDSTDIGLFSELRGVYGADGKTVVKPAVVKNLGLTTYLKGVGCSGAVAAKAFDAEIVNCHNKGSITADYAGGLVGCSKSVKIRESYNNGYFTGYKTEGGLVGYNEGDLSVENSYNMSIVMGDVVGGIVGLSEGKLSIVNSFTGAEDRYASETVPLVGAYDEAETFVDNSFYLRIYWNETPLGTLVERSDFKNGAVIGRLRDYNKNGIDGSVWGQRLNVDTIPQLTGVVSVASSKESVVIKVPSIVEGCYQIGSAEELYGLALVINSFTTSSSYGSKQFCAKLTKDIVVNKNVLLNDTLNGKGDEFIPWLPIKNFAGHFDGAGHTVSGLYLNNESDVDVGFIASVLDRANENVVIIENLGIEDSYFNALDNIGAIVGNVKNPTNAVVKNCHSSSFMRGRNKIGLVGFQDGRTLTIENSYNNGRIENSDKSESYAQAGGLIGSISIGNIRIANSYSVAKIAQVKKCSGSLIGSVYGGKYTTIINSYGIDSFAKQKSEEPMNPVGCYYNGYSVDFINVFAEKTGKRSEGTNYGTYPVSYVDAEYFTDGTVATLLHNYVTEGYDGLIWGQKVGAGSYPVLNGNVSASVTLSDLELVTFPRDTVKYFNKYKEGVVSVLPIPTKKDDVFKGWYKNSDYSGEPVKSIPEDAKGKQTFYAKWEHYPLRVDGCYEIANAKELYYFVEIADSLNESLCAKLTADIVVNEKVLVDGKLDSSRASSFKKWPAFRNYLGVFDGNGHVISGLYGYSSFIGNSEKGSLVIKNLDIKDSYFFDRNYNAGFVSVADSVTLVIANSSFDGVVTGYRSVGGFIGRTNRSNVVIAASYNKGDVAGTYDVGGFVGYSGNDRGNASLSVMYSYNSGSIKGIKGVAGFVGEEWSDSVHISNSYNVGSVYAGEMYAGGFIAGVRSHSAFIYNSYNLGDIAGADSSDAIVPFKGKNAKLELDSVFYENNSLAIWGGKAVATEDFANKKLLKRLQSYKNNGLNGSAWVQGDSDKYPVLNKTVSDKFIDSIVVAISIPNSSSSAESSSSQKADQSSSSHGKSSSSSAKSKSSSSAKVSIASIWNASPIAVRSLGRMVEISGLQAGECYALLDMQGRLLQQGYTNGETTLLPVARPGRYLVRVAGQMRSVVIR